MDRDVIRRGAVGKARNELRGLGTSFRDDRGASVYTLPPYERYTAGMDRDRYQREASRLTAILRAELQNKGVSIRSLEQKMGVGNSVYQKLLGGKITVTLAHLLQIADALDLDWQELFRRAYFPASEAAGAAAPPAAEEFDQKVMDVLRRHGLIGIRSTE
jgi:transcriptional regulator with XRE-family HTH domain